MREFYASVRRVDGEPYSKSSLCNIRAGIQRHIASPPYNRVINIIRNATFQQANNVLDGLLKNQKRDKKDTTSSYPPISKGDMEKLAQSGVLKTEDPRSLQRMVFFNLQYYFCRRGREGNRGLSKEDFKILCDDVGREYVAMNYKEHSKNHQGTLSNNFQSDKRMYATGGESCPVASYRKYISKLNPKCECLYQRPKGVVSEDDLIWYDNAPVGHNTLGGMMKAISASAELSKSYTNHSIRATTIVNLNEAGFEDRIICSLSGHRNAASLKSYCADASVGQKRQMTDALRYSIPPAGGRTADRGAGERTAFRGAGERTADRGTGGRTADRGAGERTADLGAGERTADRGAGGRTADRGAGGRTADRGAGGRTVDRGTDERTADRGAGGRTVDRGAGGRTADRGAGGRTVDRGRAGGRTADRGAGGRTVDCGAGGDTTVDAVLSQPPQSSSTVVSHRSMAVHPPQSEIENREVHLHSMANAATALQPLFGVCDFKGATLHFHFGR